MVITAVNTVKPVEGRRKERHPAGTSLLFTCRMISRAMAGKKMTDNPQTTKTTTEELQAINNYIHAMASIQTQMRYEDGEDLGEGLVMMVSILTLATLEKDLIEAAWRFILKYPFTTQIHPAIEILRREDLRPIEIQIADDLTPWIDYQASAASTTVPADRPRTGRGALSNYLVLPRPRQPYRSEDGVHLELHPPLREG